MQSERYNAHFAGMPPEFTIEELLERHAKGLPLSPRDRMDAERVLRASAAKAQAAE
jgi:hypothetical protein